MRQTLCRGIGVLLVFVAVASVGLVTSQRAEAASKGMNALETVGISIGIGTVFGLSTLPFYDSPGSQLGNVAIGAGVGAVVGLGVVAYQFLVGPGDDEISPEELLPPENRPKSKNGTDEKSEKKTEKGTDRGAFKSNPNRAAVPLFASVPGPLPMYAQRSLGREWAFAVQVLELRF